MLGHKLAQNLPAPIEVFTTARAHSGPTAGPGRTVFGVDAADYSSVKSAVQEVQPKAVVNCIGIVKQDARAKDPVATLTINALFPHKLNEICQSVGARLVHISTDCVFDGSRGGYVESDLPTAVDLYGRTKALGEVTEGGALTLRTSIIGRELRGRAGLVEWFLANKGKAVKGYTQAKFSGLTTIELSKVIATVLLQHPELRGLWHVASEPIDKHTLLNLLDRAYKTGARIEPDTAVAIDRTLNETAFRTATGYVAPCWDRMVAEMASDDTPYERWSN